MKELIEHSLQQGIAAKVQFAEKSSEALLALVDLLVSTFTDGGKVLIFGNGGSAADAQHLAAEFVNRFLIDRPPLAAVALTTDTSVITSIGNDFSFDDIFAKQVIALGKEGDVSLGISTSGNSTNVVLGIEAAVRQGMKTAVLTGEGGGRLADIADIVLAVPSRKTPVIQEVHLWIEHLICQLVDEILFGAKIS